MGASPTRATAPAGSNRSTTEPSECVSRIGDSASVQAVTRVNAEQALYGAFIVKRFQSSDLSFLLSRSVSLFDVESRFFAPTRSIAKPARAELSRLAVAPTLGVLRPCQATP